MRVVHHGPGRARPPMVERDVVVDRDGSVGRVEGARHDGRQPEAPRASSGRWPGASARRLRWPRPPRIGPTWLRRSPRRGRVATSGRGRGHSRGSRSPLRRRSTDLWPAQGARARVPRGPGARRRGAGRPRPRRPGGRRPGSLRGRRPRSARTRCRRSPGGPARPSWAPSTMAAKRRSDLARRCSSRACTIGSIRPPLRRAVLPSG